MSKMTVAEFEALTAEDQDKVDMGEVDWDGEEETPTENVDDTPVDIEQDDDEEEQPDDESEEDDGEGEADEDDPESEDDAESDSDGEEDTETFDPVAAILAESYEINGQSIKIDDPADIRRMVSKGLHLEQEFSLLNNDATVGRMFAGANIDVKDIGFVKDLLAGNPAAIAKLVKDKGIDLYDQDDEAIGAYKPSEEYEMPHEAVQKFNNFVAVNSYDSDFQQAVKFAETVDKETQIAIVHNPVILQTLAQHMKDGTFDSVVAELQQSRRLRGDDRPFMVAYDEIGRRQYAEKNPEAVAKQQQQQSSQQQQPQKQAPLVPKRTVKKSADVEHRRKVIQGAAKSGKKTSSNKALAGMSVSDVQSLPDADFDTEYQKLLKSI